jgi:histidine phosphotransfer protein HptB
VSLIDLTIFNELKDTAGPEFVAELVDTFLEEAPTMLADLRSARLAGAADVFRRAAHSLKSNSATFGAMEMSGLARRLELDGMSTDARQDMAAIDALDDVYRHAAAALQELARG